MADVYYIVTLSTAEAGSGPNYNVSYSTDCVTYLPATPATVSLEVVGSQATITIPDTAQCVKLTNINSNCTNSVSSSVSPTTTTTTTTTSTTTTTTIAPTTTTTTIAGTTTTTTLTYCQSIGAGAGCFNWNFTAGSSGAIVQWTDCSGNNQTRVLSDGESGNACLCDGYSPTVLEGSLAINSQVGQCVDTTTTTAGPTTTTTTTAGPTYNYYDVTRFDCPDCTNPAYSLVARNNTTGGTLTTSHYYNNGDGYVYRIDGYNAGTSYTIDLDGSATSGTNCSATCAI
jgi:hypothetical protein